MAEGKLIIFSAPSGSGKTTIVQHLLRAFPYRLAFSVSATSRAKRGTEVNDKDYHYLSPEEFRIKIDNGDFLEWEEVYPGTYYGTLKAEVQQIWDNGKHVIFDIDVEGGLNLKNQFKERALSIFVLPPSIKILEERLKTRSTDNPESIARRLAKAESEMKTAQLFDTSVLNEKLDDAFAKAEQLVNAFLNS